MQLVAQSGNAATCNSNFGLHMVQVVTVDDESLLRHPARRAARVAQLAVQVGLLLFCLSVGGGGTYSTGSSKQ